MFQDNTLSEFTQKLASHEPVPGGGGAAAMVAAVGVALGSMVGEYTLGKKKYADVEDEIRALMEQAGKLRQQFLSFADRDAEAFLPLSKAYGLPKDDPDRDRVLEEALREAASVPLSLMESCRDGLRLMKGFREKGSKLMQSDALCGTYFLKAALQAASCNVYINTELMKDRERASETEEKAGALLSEGLELAAVIVGEN